MRGHERNKHNLQNSLQKSRDNAEENFKEVFQTAVDLGVKSDTQPAIPRLCRQTQRSNIPANDPMSYFRASFPWLHDSRTYTDRFTPIQNDMALASMFVPSVLLETENNSLIKEELKTIQTAFPDMPSHRGFYSDRWRWSGRHMKRQAVAFLHIQKPWNMQILIFSQTLE